MKKRGLLLILTALLLIACKSSTSQVKVNESDSKELAFLSHFGKDQQKVPFERREIKANFPEYTTGEDLRNVVNRDHIMEHSPMTADEISKLVENRFFVRGSDYGYEQPFSLYEINEYFYIPNFVTTDSIIHLYHVFYDNLLKELEKKDFLPRLKELTKEMLLLAEDDYQSAQHERIKKAALKNFAYFLTEAKLLKMDIDMEIPQEVNEILQAELKSIEQKEINESRITGQLVNYTQFTPRGHYTSSDELKTYFKAVMWYSQIKLYPYIDKKPAEDQLISIFLITKNMFSDEEMYEKYDDITKTLNFLVENTEDLNVDSMARIYFSIYGKDSSIEDLIQEEKLKEAYEKLEEVSDPTVNPKEGLNFSLLPQRAVVDAQWVQKLLDTENEPSKRPIHSGMDVMAILGSELAKEYQLNQEENKHWEKYPKALDETMEEISQLEDDFWQKNLYRGWLWALQEYTHEFPKGYPAFMTNQAWLWKNLNSALGSWAELKHDTVLYGKQASAEMGGGMEAEMKHFVEPNIGLYEKLDWLLNFSMVNLKERQLLTQDQVKGFENLISLNQFLIECSVKELENQPLSKEDQERLTYIGGEMENIYLNFVDPTVENFMQIEEAADRNMTIIADVGRVGPNQVNQPVGTYLEVGIGPAQEIFVAYPVGDQVYIGRGAVFDYYEFLSEELLTDEDWRKMRFDAKEIHRPDWTDHYLEKEIPFVFDQETETWIPGL
ncbi:MAG: DUF3160 domain-containing protein [Tissierellia bacterium]|nr:DUF3160 domain-containing protein [Tissierellia bacterium]